jgi:hypothetical protein
MTPGIPPARPLALSLVRSIDPDLNATFVPAGPLPGAASAREAPPFEDGRYAGANAEVAIELRVDRTGCGVISGDVYRVLADSRGYVASFRTAPGTRVNVTGPWAVIGQDEHGRVVQGSVALDAQPDLAGTIFGQLRFDGPLEGLPTRTSIPFIAQFTGRAFRSLGIEKEIEEGVADIGTFAAGDRRIDITDALLAAGFDTRVAGITDRIAKPPQGWDMAQLHTLMSDLSQAPLLRRSWDIHVLLLSKSDRAGLLGVMFDTSDALPRQGCAIFAEEIRGIQGIDHERKLIQTTVHEVGHALNLAHRFERVVGRADSLSFMNYDWRYRGGRRESEFWNQFAFSFDPDELEFLRHAPLPPLIPGGAPFHSVPYWADGTGGYSPYVPESPLAGWTLTMMPPDTGAVLRFAQPVLMRVLLTNKSGRTIEIPKFMLDPKAGFLEVLIKRVNSGAVGRAKTTAESFTPLMQRCFQWDAADAVRLNDGESMEDNINLTFGSGGFAFAEPGTYDVTTLLVIFDQAQQRDLIVPSNTIRIRIGAPRTDQDELDAMDFFTPEVGMYLTLGGSAALTKTGEMLDALADRRNNDLDDPLVAYITRARAIDSARAYVRYEDHRFYVSQPNLEHAATLLTKLRDNATPVFDAATARQTAKLADVCQAKWKGKETNEPIVIGPSVLPRDASSAAIENARRSSYLPIGKERFAR